MKKLLSIFGCALLSTALLFVSCSPSTSTPTPEETESTPKTEPKDNSVKVTDIKIETGVTEETTDEDGTFYKVDAATTTAQEGHGWLVTSLSLQDFAEKTIDITFSAKMKIVSGTTPVTLSWQINAVDKDGNAAYPTVASQEFSDNEWVTVTGSASSVILSKYPVLYISKPTDVTNLVIYLKDVEAKVTVKNITWLDSSVPSLYETYKDYFDYFGFAVEYGNTAENRTELYYKEIQNGLKKHANTLSLGNEFKPDFVFNWGWWRTNKDSLVDFTASNGKTIKVPNNIPAFELQDEILQLCKDMNVHMRGHVLLWHSQTPAQFFYEDFGYPIKGENPSNTKMVDAETMDARLEWYIKTVIQHCDKYTLSDGTPVIWAWDVANEATSDGSQSDAATSTDYTHWLRTSGSNWYTVYKAAEDNGVKNYYTGSTYKAYDFVVNAFRFANKYAKPGTKLVYNDYGGLAGTSTSAKHKSQMRLVQYILDHNSDAVPTRIDAMGLQSHYSVQNSTTAYETEIKDFINKGLDVQITELDIASCANYDPETDTVGCSGKQFASVADAYYSFMQMFIKNRKTSSKAGVSCVTIWGLSDQQTWLNTIGQNQWIGNCQQYPLLFNLINNVSSKTNTYEFYTDSTKTTKKSLTLESFDEGDSYSPKNAFYSVIKAATEYSE